MKTTYKLIRTSLFFAVYCFFANAVEAQCTNVGQIATLTATVSPCQPSTNTANVTGGLTFSSLSANGASTLSIVLVMPSTGLTLTQTISPPYIIGGSYPFTFTGIPSNGTGFTITASFLYPGPCGLTISLLAPVTCVCATDAGTFNQNVVGSTSSTGPNQFHLCYNDVMYISSNGDDVPPPDMTSSWGSGTPPVFSPGLWLLRFSCPPSVSSPASILSDPCYLGVQSTANGYWQLSNWTGVQQTFYYVPVTVYSQANNVYAVNTNGGGYCYDLGAIHEVTYLNEIVGVSTPDCLSGVVATNFTGGMPAFNGSNFTVVPGSLAPATASFVNTTCGNNGDIEISGLVSGDNYSYDVVDSKNCPVTISGTFSGPAISDFTYPQQNYCLNEANPSPTLGVNSTAGGVYTSSPAGLYLNSITGAIDLSFSAVGSYTVNYTTSNAACPTSTNFTINLGALPYVSIANQTACAGTTASFTPSTFPVSTYDYTWTTPAGVSNPGNVSPLVASVAGAYSVYITDQITNCSSAPSSANLTLNPQPTVQVADEEFCIGASATLTAVTPQTGAITYNWTVPAGVPAPGNVASFSTNLVGSYSLQIAGSNGCLSLPAVANVTMSPAPDVTFNNPSFCAGSSAALTATTTPAATYSYVWTVPFGAVNPGNVSSFSINTGGVYTVQITDVNSGCSSSVVDGYISELPLPTVSVNSPSICTGASANITATPGTVATYTYNWTVPAGVPAPGNVASFSSSVAGNYAVQITNDVSGCVSTVSAGTLTINPLPTVQVSDETFCNGTMATLVANSPQVGPMTYNWTVPAGVSAPGDVASFATDVVGNYTVQITDPNGCISVIDAANVSVNNGPNATLNDSTICAGASAILTASTTSSGTFTYAWTVPAGVANPGSVNSISTSVAGTYTVQITDINSSCSGTVLTGDVTVIALPTVAVNSPSICAGTSATITATPGVTGTYSYGWTVPTGVPAPGNVASFSSTIAGNYAVHITNDATGCVSPSSSGVLTINPLPTVQVSDETFCIGTSATLTAVTPQTGAINYNWTVPIGAVAPGNVPSFTTNAVGNYTVQITDLNGCTSIAATGIVTVNNGPTASLNDSIICAGTNALLTATTGATGIFDYVWTVPVGAVNPGNVSSILTNTAGSYTVQMTDVNSGCTGAVANGNVTVVALPTVAVNSPTICAGTNATISATPGFLTAYSYIWTVPSGAAAPGNVASFSSNVAGTYAVQIINSATGCLSPSLSGTLTVNPLPTVLVSDAEFCFGTNATVAAITPQTGVNYNWNVPVGATAPGNVSSFSTNVVGNYTVQITDVNGCSSVSISANVSVDNGPVASLNDSIICTGANALLTATAATTGTFDYLWTVPVGVVNPGNANSISTTIAGGYSVQITDVNTGCTGTIGNGNVTVLAVPTVLVNNPSVCAGTNTSVTATPGSAATYTYVWTVPAGAAAPGNVASFSSSMAGNYAVQITDNATGCVSPSSSGTITINALPTVQVSDEEFCFGTNATLTALSPQTGIMSYNWTVPAGATAPGDVASFTTNVTGMYFVQISDANGCTSLTDTAIVTVDNGPGASLNDSIICSGANALLTASTTAIGTFSYVWTAPAGVANPGNINSISTSIAGTYSVQITDVNSGCSGLSANGDVTVIPLPTVVVNTTPVCAGASATISATPGNASTYTYVWTVPVGVPAPGNVTSFSSTIAGVYDIQITDGVTGCVSPIASGTQVVNPIPTVLVNSVTICDGTSASITATPAIAGGYSYAWSVPTGVVDPGNVATFTASVDGIYSVVISDNLTSCSSVSTTGVLTVLPNPTIDAGIDQIGCDTDSFTLSANGVGVGGNYVWTSGVVDGVPFMPTAGLQTYSVTGTTVDGCIGVDDVDIFVDQTPVVSFNFVADGQCAPVEAVFTNTSNPAGTNCTWSFDNGDVINNCGPVTYLFTDAGLFGVNLQVESVIAGCVSNAYQANIINVEDNPIADFVYSPDEITTLYNEVDFENTTSGATNYTWSFGDNSGGSVLENPTHQFLNPGAFEVTLLASTPGGCLDSVSVVIEVKEEELFYVPNAFTPDGNEFNNLFQPVFTSGFEPQEFELLIFSRWGEVIFKSQNADFGWDGTFSSGGKVCPDGVYIWKITYRTTDTNERNTLSGHVQLIR